MQSRVLFALVMREMATRFGRSAGGYVWAILEPAGTVALLTLVFSQISRRPALGSDYALFFATGYLAFHVYKDVSSGVSQAINANKALFSFPRVSMLDPVIARFILHSLTAVLVYAIVVGGLHAVSESRYRIDFAPLFVALSLSAALGLGVGALNCLLFAFSPTWEKTFNVLNRPLFLISGVLFIYEDLPRALREIIWWNPLIHVTALSRDAFYPAYDPIFVSPGYVLGAAMAPLLAAVLLLRRLKSRILE